MSTSLQPSSNFDNDCVLILHLRSVPEKHAQTGIVRNYHLGCNIALYCQTDDVYIYFTEN